MLQIRHMEQWVIDQYTSQTIAINNKENPEHTIKCPTHLSIGQEAMAVGACTHLRRDDVIFSNHRCHGHYLAKGGDPYRMVAELLGRKTGCAEGRGGSMHLVDPSVGMMGSTAIVGGSIALGAGAALAFKQTKQDRVALTFFGDGAVEEGIFHESLQVAGQWNLPIIFVCENNFYATLSHLTTRQKTPIHERAASYGIPGVHIDGNDIFAVEAAANVAIERARRGDGPTLIVGDTYRWYGHVGYEPDTGKMARTPEELSAWKEKCPIKRLQEHLLTEHSLDELRAIEQTAQETINAAVVRAKQDPLAT